MKLDSLWSFIVPLTFLAIWALTALFNRDGSPLPPRVASSNNPYGPRPSPPPQVTRQAPMERSPAIRWGPTTGVGSPSRTTGNDDDIVIIEPTRPVRPAANKGVVPPRRPKQKIAQTTRPTQPQPAKGGLGGVSQSVNQHITKTLTLQPLTETSVATPVQSVSSATASVSIDSGDVKRGLAGVAAAFLDPKRLREAIIVNEILQPPVSMRRNRRI